jgi:4-amino-4-deoxy-L-arabinose transferase-like glycosyltransferase
MSFMRVSRETKIDLARIVALSVVSIAAVVTTSNDIGFTYDEPLYAIQAQKAAQWLQLVFTEPSTAFSREGIDEHWNPKVGEINELQPATTKWVNGIVGALTGGNLRAGTAVFFALMVSSVYWLGARAFNRTVGLFAACALGTLPRVFGHAHLTTLDVPVAAMVMLTTVLVWNVPCPMSHVQFQRKLWIAAIVAGVALGLAVGTKMNGLLVLPSVLLWMAVMRKWSWQIVVALFVVAPLTFFLTWPWLWLNPTANAFEYFKYHLRHYPVLVTYFGRNYEYAPWHYPLVMIGMTTPTLVLLLSFAGVVAQVGNLRHKNEIDARSLLLLSLLVQLAAFMLPTTPKYNGVRIFLPVFPFLALFAGVGFDALCRWLTQRVKTEQMSPALLIALLGIVCLAPSLKAIAYVHPFELSYYNALIGGVRGAVARGFEPTYWGETLVHACDTLNKHTPPNGLVCITPGGAISYLKMYQRIGLIRSDVRFSDFRRIQDTDAAVFHTRLNELTDDARQLLHEGKPAFARTLDDVPLVVVFTRDEIQRVLK